MFVRLTASRLIQILKRNGGSGVKEREMSFPLRYGGVFFVTDAVRLVVQTGDVFFGILNTKKKGVGGTKVFPFFDEDDPNPFCT